MPPIDNLSRDYLSTHFTTMFPLGIRLGEDQPLYLINQRFSSGAVGQDRVPRIADLSLDNAVEGIGFGSHCLPILPAGQRGINREVIAGGQIDWFIVACDPRLGGITVGFLGDGVTHGTGINLLQKSFAYLLNIYYHMKSNLSIAVSHI